MLSRSFFRARPVHAQRYFSAASPVGFPEYQKRMNDLQKQYPGLYKDTKSFVGEQDKVIDSVHANLPKSIEEYNQARQKVADLTGEDVYMTLTPELLQSSISTVTVPDRSPQEVERQFSVGNVFIQKLIGLQNGIDALNETQKTLRSIEIQDMLDQLDYWKMRLQDDVDDPGDMGLPLPEDELDNIVRQAYFHSPPEVKTAAAGVSIEEHEQIENKWMESLDELLGAEIAKRVPGFDTKKWMAYSALLNQLFHPRDIDHYPLNDYAKSLIRAVFWQGEDRLESIIQSMNVLEKKLAEDTESWAAMLRGAYESRNDNPNQGIAAMQLRLSDPLFSARLVRDVRARLDSRAFDLSVSDSLRDLEMPLLAEEKKELLEEGDSPPVRRALEVLQEQEAKYSAQMESLDAILDDILPTKVWGNDHSPVKQAFTQYASGKGSLADVNKAFDTAVKPNGNAVAMSDEDILRLAVDCHQTKMGDYGFWSLSEMLNESRFVRAEEDVLRFRRLVKEAATDLGLDPLVTNLLRVLVEDHSMDVLPSVIGDFGILLKKFLGEVEATISVASNVSDEDFNAIVTALQKANPEKKFTIDRRVDAGLMGGFIVKAGVQTFDHSLTTEVTNARRQMNV